MLIELLLLLLLRQLFIVLLLELGLDLGAIHLLLDQTVLVLDEFSDAPEAFKVVTLLVFLYDRLRLLLLLFLRDVTEALGGGRFGLLRMSLFHAGELTDRCLVDLLQVCRDVIVNRVASCTDQRAIELPRRDYSRLLLCFRLILLVYGHHLGQRPRDRPV